MLSWSELIDNRKQKLDPHTQDMKKKVVWGLLVFKNYPPYRKQCAQFSVQTPFIIAVVTVQ